MNGAYAVRVVDPSLRLVPILDVNPKNRAISRYQQRRAERAKFPLHPPTTAAVQYSSQSYSTDDTRGGRAAAGTKKQCHSMVHNPQQKEEQTTQPNHDCFQQQQYVT